MQEKEKAICAVAMAALTGCASIVKGGNQDIPIQSTPSEARYEVKRKSDSGIVSAGVTPATIRLEKGEGYFDGAEYEITISKQGFSSQVINVSSNLSGWYLGNIVIGGLIGWIAVDPATGAMWTLSPEAIQATLANSEVAAEAASAAALMAPSVATGDPVEAPAAPVAQTSMAAAPTTVIAVATQAPVVDPNAPMVRAASVLRAQPRAQTRGMQSVTAGTPVSVLGSLSNTEGQWYYVSAAGANGWLHVGEIANLR